jgi:hypothetical protein
MLMTANLSGARPGNRSGGNNSALCLQVTAADVIGQRVLNSSALSKGVAALSEQSCHIARVKAVLSI